MKFITTILLLSLFISQFSFGQRENKYTLESSAVIGTDQTPFWMRANKFGKVPTKGQTLATFAGVKSDFQNPKSKIDWGYGLNVGGFVGMQNKFIIQQAFIKAKWRAFEIYAGRREEIQGLVDTTLTSGSYIWSGNALPMSKVDIGIRDFTPIGSSGIFSIKGNYSHGWFYQNRNDTKGVFLHQKSFYFKIGMPNYKFKFIGGFNHQAQWGRQQLSGNSRKIESSFKDYLNVIMGKSNVGEDTTGLDPNSAGNRTGNHLGSLDIGLEFKLPKAQIFIYRQSIFEDGSLFYLNNISDGLHGISIYLDKSEKKIINITKINFEFLSTLSQGGLLGSAGGIPASRRGRDNYFNNGDYPEGWSYQQTSIGTPFILSKGQYYKSHSLPQNHLFFTNNRVEAYTISFQGNALNQINFTCRFSFSKNWGNYSFGFSEKVNQSSLFVQLNKDFINFLGGINIYGNIAGDFGDLLDSNGAIQIGVKKSMNYLPFFHTTHKH
jgi:Capsule assembly protein Wzi